MGTGPVPGEGALLSPVTMATSSLSLACGTARGTPRVTQQSVRIIDKLALGSHKARSVPPQQPRILSEGLDSEEARDPHITDPTERLKYEFSDGQNLGMTDFVKDGFFN